MKFKDITTIIDSINENELIIKENLTLSYKLNETEFNDLQEEIFYMFNSFSKTEFIPEDEFEVEYSDIIINFTKLSVFK